MDNVIQCTNVLFVNQDLDKLVNNLNELIKSRQNNFAELCTCVAKIYNFCKDNHYMSKDNDYYNAYKLLAKFGFERKSVERIVRCYNKYIDQCDNNVAKLKSVFFHFSPSKLFLLLTVSNKQLIDDLDKKILVPTMTCKEIKDYIKNLQGKKDNNKVLEESTVDISDEETEEEFYDCNKHYDLEYFEKLSQKQLVSIAYKLQFEYEKLRSKLNK